MPLSPQEFLPSEPAPRFSPALFHLWQALDGMLPPGHSAITRSLCAPAAPQHAKRGYPGANNPGIPLSAPQGMVPFNAKQVAHPNFLCPMPLNRARMRSTSPEEVPTAPLSTLPPGRLRSPMYLASSLCIWCQHSYHNLKKSFRKPASTECQSTAKPSPQEQ